ncbi:MAG: DMT family transporter [Candidatus Saccharibacteria bacterium]|nr:DMT family transporter [Pseudorhodobacter sp.]
MGGSAIKGVGLVVAATLLFAAADVLGKVLIASYSVPLIMAMRYVVNVGLLGLALGPLQGTALWQTHRLFWVVVRGLCLAAASLTMGLALRVMPVGETVAIVYLAPILVMLLAGLVLGETVPLAGWIGAAVGFAGVLVIVRPGAGLDPWGVTLCLINAGLGTAYHLLTKVLGRTETMAAMLFYTALSGAVVFWTMVGVGGVQVWPGWRDLALMGLLGALATVGHFLFTAAYREAPASLLAPVNYLHLVWAATLGAVVFGHVPDGITLAGMAMVAGAGVAVALRAQFGPRPVEPS